MSGVWRTRAAAAVAILLAVSATLWAEDQTQPEPQGPGRAVMAPQAPTGLVGYKPIPESMLPGAMNPGANAVGVPQAEMPYPTNLGGPAMTLGPYTLGPDDVVNIAVNGQPDFSGTYVIGADGLNLRRITTTESWADRPTWSPPPFNEIAYAGRSGPGYDVKVYDLASGQTRQATFGEGSNESPAFSPNGINRFEVCLFLIRTQFKK